jgi:hypothetical protein
MFCSLPVVATRVPRSYDNGHPPPAEYYSAKSTTGHGELGAELHGMQRLSFIFASLTHALARSVLSVTPWFIPSSQADIARLC